MKDIIVKAGCTYKVQLLLKDENGNNIIWDKNLDEVLPIDRVVTIDNNGYTYLYDQCIQITEDMIEKEL